MTQRTTTAAEYLAKAIELSNKSQREIAQAAGYAKPNVLSMMKLGQTKIPIDKVPALARACGVDPSAFMRIVLREYLPETWAVINETVGEPLTRNERRLVETYREVAPDGDLDIDPTVAFKVKEALEAKAAA